VAPSPRPASRSARRSLSPNSACSLFMRAR